MITGTELRVLRQNCGLTQEDVADLIGCDLRSVKRWEAGKSRISDRVVAILQKIDDALNAYAAKVLKAYADQTEAIDPDELPEACLILYDDDDADMVAWSLPFHTHVAAVFKAFTLLRQNGVPAHIVKFRREDYFAFLAGRPDSQAERSAWAALQTQKDKAP